MTAADGADGKRILVFAESTISWNALLPVVMGLRQRAGLQRAKIGVSRPADKDHVEWYFISAASARLFRELYVPADDAMVPSWDIFVVSMKSPFVDLTPAQHVVCVHHGVGFGNHPYSLQMYASSTLYCGLSPAEADYIAEQTGERPPPGRFVATGAPRNDRLAPFLAATPDVR